MNFCTQSDIDRNAFINENKGFIYNTASTVCRRKLSWENDDELSVALIAFNSACDKYDDNKGNFFSYSKVIIKNALIDYFRKSKNNPYLVFNNEDTEQSQTIENKISLTEYEKSIENKLRAEEINMLSSELSQYGLSFSDLVKSSPSHIDTRNNLLNLAFNCVREDTILVSIKEKKQLPIKNILLLTNSNRKYIEKWRRYILSLIIILSNNEYNYIKSYLNIRAGEKNDK